MLIIFVFIVHKCVDWDCKPSWFSSTIFFSDFSSNKKYTKKQKANDPFQRFFPSTKSYPESSAKFSKHNKVRSQEKPEEFSTHTLGDSRFQALVCVHAFSKRPKFRYTNCLSVNDGKRICYTRHASERVFFWGWLTRWQSKACFHRPSSSVFSLTSISSCGWVVE